MADVGKSIEELQAIQKATMIARNEYLKETLEPAKRKYGELCAAAQQAEKNCDAFIRAQERKANKARLNNFLAGKRPIVGRTVQELIEGGGKALNEYDYISPGGQKISHVNIIYEVTQAMLDATGLKPTGSCFQGKTAIWITCSVKTYEEAKKLYDAGAELSDGWRYGSKGKICIRYLKSQRSANVNPGSIYATEKAPEPPKEPKPEFTGYLQEKPKGA